MMTIAKIFLLCLFIVCRNGFAEESISRGLLTTDNRIRTYIYNPNEVYTLFLNFGFQSHIEFGKEEDIQTISLGDSYLWKITTIDNRLFIKPLEKNIMTNMTVITNKNSYQFDLIAKDTNDDEEPEFIYVLRFIYPKKTMR